MAVNDDTQASTLGPRTPDTSATPGEPAAASPSESGGLGGTRISRRALIGRGLAAGVGIAGVPAFLAACGGGGSSSSGVANIQFAALVDQTGEQTNEINTFNQLHAGKIHVDFLQLPPVATDQYGKFVTAFRSQSATPDVVQIDVTWPAQFATPGWLHPLDSYVNSTYLKQFWPGAVTVGQVNGKQYAIQRFMDVGMLYYRTDLVQKYGGTVPATRDQMQAMAQQIMAAEQGNGIKFGYLMPGKKIEAIVDEWLEFIWGAGGNIGTPGNLNVDGDVAVAALQYMHDLIYTLKLAPAGTNTYAPNDILALFQAGQSPFMRNWTYAFALANDPSKSKIAGKFAVAPTLATTGNQGHGCTGGWVLGINAYSQHKDAAWTFIDYMLSKDTQTSMAKNAKLISSRPDVVNDPAVQSSVSYFSQLGTVLQTAKSRPPLTNYNQFTTPLQAAINGVLSNQGSASSALSGVQSQIGSLK